MLLRVREISHSSLTFCVYFCDICEVSRPRVSGGILITEYCSIISLLKKALIPSATGSGLGLY